MPELPEVDNFRRFVEGTSLDQTIEGVEINDNKVLTDSDEEFSSALVGSKISGTDRVGKYLFLKLSSGRSLMVHFGMTGSWYYYKDQEEKPRHARVVFHFDSGFELAYNCPRKFGRLTLCSDPASYSKEHKLGTDALKISFEEFHDKIAGRKTPIKSALMNQSILAGVGNWIADEVLYHARMHPNSKVKDLSTDQLRHVFDKVKFVCETAISLEAHFPDFPKDFMIHSRWTDSGRPDAPRLDLEIMKIGGRTTYFDPKIQVLY